MKPYIAHVVRYRRGRLYRAVDYAACVRIAREVSREMAEMINDPRYRGISATGVQEYRGGKPRRWG